jgi:transposase
MFRRSLTILRKRYRRALKKVKTTYFVFDSGNNNDGNVERMDDLCATHRSWWFVAGLKKDMMKAEILATPEDEFELLYSYEDTRILGKTIEKELYGKKRKVLLYFNGRKKERATRIFKLRVKKATVELDGIVKADIPLDAKLERIHAFLKEMRMVTLFDITADKDGRVGYEINAKERDGRLALFGKFAVFTNNLDLPAEKILSVFKSKNVVEHGFHLYKGLLLIRPVNHRLPRRIRAHLAIVVWGMTLLSLLRSQLHDNGIEHSFEDLMDIIVKGELRVGDYVYPELKRTYRTRTLIDVNEPLTSVLRCLKIPTDHFSIELLPTE